MQTAFQNITFEEKYKYYTGGYWNYNLNLSENSLDNIQMVSIDAQDNIRGFLCAEISRNSDKISSLAIINFYGKNAVFSKDLYQFIKNLFVKFNFRKVEFGIVVGNPIEKMYDKYIEKYNGSITGIQHKSIKLQDNLYYDEKFYEIFREDCIELLK